jgi:hypothetical protein
VDAQTLESWIQKAGYDVTPEASGGLRIRPKSGEPADLPPFIGQRSENGILLSILPVIDPNELAPDDLFTRLLSVNREMRLSKFALGENDEVVLCAELPTESLDYSELSDAIGRMVRYFTHYRGYLGLITSA